MIWVYVLCDLGAADDGSKHPARRPVVGFFKRAAQKKGGAMESEWRLANHEICEFLVEPPGADGRILFHHAWHQSGRKNAGSLQGALAITDLSPNVTFGKCLASLGSGDASVQGAPQPCVNTAFPAVG